MSKKVYVVNEHPVYIRETIKRVSKNRILKNCSIKGYPAPTNANKFLIVISVKGYKLCYRYYKNPTEIMDLDPLELPMKGWKVYVKV